MDARNGSGTPRRQQLSLPDGTRVSWRYVVPSDRAEFEARFGELSAQSRYQRFHTAADSLPPAVWDDLVGSVDQQRHIALLMMVDEEPVAVCHVIRQRKHPRTADVAVTVADRWQGRGVGRLILRQALAVAGDIESIDTYVLAGNDAALRLLNSLGPLTVECDQGQCRVRVDLAPERAHEASPTSRRTPNRTGRAGLCT